MLDVDSTKKLELFIVPWYPGDYRAIMANYATPNRFSSHLQVMRYAGGRYRKMQLISYMRVSIRARKVIHTLRHF